MSEKLPRSAVKLAAEALRELGVHPGDNEEVARAALLAVQSLIERCVRRDVAREVLWLHENDRQCTSVKGPYGDMTVSLNKLSRGEPLPDWRDLHGGELTGKGGSNDR